MKKSVHPKRCKLGTVIDDLCIKHPDEGDALLFAVEQVRLERDLEVPPAAGLFTVTWLASILQDNGHAIGKTVVSDHVRKVCACESGQ